MGTIEGLACGDRLRVAWSDGEVTELSWAWVRDHSRDPASYDARTGQRLVDSSVYDPARRGVTAQFAGGAIVVEWSDGSTASIVPVELLDDVRRPAAGDDRVLWDRTTVESMWPTVAHDDVVADDSGVAELLDRVHWFGFCIVEGTPPTAAATQRLVERIGYVRETIFGGFWEFQPDAARDDTAYTNIELPPHTDGTYSHDAPGAQILHCLGHDGDGGESTMVDGFAVAAELRRSSPDHHATLATVEVPGRYVGDGAHLVARRPILRHEGERLVQVSYNSTDRAPFLLPPDEADRFYAAVATFEAMLADPDRTWERRLRPGEAMIFDNWRVLHGRRSFTGARRMCGAYVNREDVDSRRRVLSGR